MKTRILKSVLALAMMAMALPMMGQDYVNVNLKNGEINQFLLNNVSKIFTSKTDANGNQYGDYQFQYITTADGETVYELDDIESLTFVKSEEPVVPDGPVAIDLGLPSGTKWASCNVGATKPEEYGGYYAWGETEEKEVYSDDTYKYYQNGSYVNLGDISGTEYDVAHVKWGGDWVMPTMDDIKELLNYCTSEWTTINGVNGRKFTGPNSNSIFLPAAGEIWGSRKGVVGRVGYYLSSIPGPSYSHIYDSEGGYYLPDYSNYLYCTSNKAEWANNNCPRYIGISVRPVVKPEPPEVSVEAIIHEGCCQNQWIGN